MAASHGQVRGETNSVGTHFARFNSTARDSIINIAIKFVDLGGVW
jgi:hypothetical protein